MLGPSCTQILLTPASLQVTSISTAIWATTKCEALSQALQLNYTCMLDDKSQEDTKHLCNSALIHVREHIQEAGGSIPALVYIWSCLGFCVILYHQNDQHLWLKILLNPPPCSVGLRSEEPEPP